MSYSYVILGAGRQGVALAYDLARNCDATRITLAELSPVVAKQAIDRLGRLLPETTCRFQSVACDAGKPAEVALAIDGADVVLSAVPYRLNVALTDAAIAAGASLCDLGGNTDVVETQLTRHDAARRAGVSIAPDCGLAPGLGNILAAHGVGLMDGPQHVHVRCGGLPERPVGPLGYKLVFNFQGLVNEYSGVGVFLREGQRIEIPTLTELEEIEFPAPVGRCEAAVTSGGTSTCAETFAGRLQSYDYKTVRYPGHFAIVRAMFVLGCFDEEVRGVSVSPRAVMRDLMEARLQFPEVQDLVVLRTTVQGMHAGRPRTIRYDLFDRQDDATGFSAMERATAFPAALVAHMQARKMIPAGARPLEVCVPTSEYLAELPRHDLQIDTHDA